MTPDDRLNPTCSHCVALGWPPASAARAQAERCVADLRAAQRNLTPKVRAAVDGWRSGETPFSIRYAAALRDALSSWS